MSELPSASRESCSIKRTLDLLGEKWTMLVLREAFYGVRRFDDFQRNIGCARNILSSRLTLLVERGVMRREPYREPKSRPRDEYRLTDKGRELLPIILALMQWGDRWDAPPEGPAVVVRHNGCQRPVRVVIECADGHGPLTARDTHAVPGLGALHAA
jgi:DNA-binding HxlR family transcriptional regulator